MSSTADTVPDPPSRRRRAGSSRRARDRSRCASRATPPWWCPRRRRRHAATPRRPAAGVRSTASPQSRPPVARRSGRSPRCSRDPPDGRGPQAGGRHHDLGIRRDQALGRQFEPGVGPSAVGRPARGLRDRARPRDRLAATRPCGAAGVVDGHLGSQRGPALEGQVHRRAPRPAGRPLRALDDVVIRRPACSTRRSPRPTGPTARSGPEDMSSDRSTGATTAAAGREAVWRRIRASPSAATRRSRCPQRPRPRWAR